MAKLTDVLIGVGTTANDKKGDSLRAAFQKVNLGFTDLYTKLGLVDGSGLNLGAFTFTGSTMSTDDSTNIVIDKPITVNGEITVDGDIVPKTNLGSSLGTPTRQFKSLYVSTNTIYINNVPLSLDSSNNILVNGSLISGGTAETGDFTFASSNLYASGAVELTNGSTADEDWNAGIQIPARNAEGDLYIRNISVEGNNVVVQTSHGTWTYGHDGTFNLPGMAGGIGSYIQATNDITINANGTEYKFSTEGRTTFPNGTVPEHSYGAAGDKEGMVVFTDPYIYYCKQDYSTSNGIASITIATPIARNDSLHWDPATTVIQFAVPLDVTDNPAGDVVPGGVAATGTPVFNGSGDLTGINIDTAGSGYLRVADGGTASITDIFIIQTGGTGGNSTREIRNGVPSGVSITLTTTDIWVRVAWTGTSW